VTLEFEVIFKKNALILLGLYLYIKYLLSIVYEENMIYFNFKNINYKLLLKLCFIDISNSL
jgi:hypothetical protein